MKKILVLEGGFNEEHEISLKTSKEVQKSLKRMKLKFEVLKVNPKNFSEKIKLYDKNFLCFNALHGTFGEDGSIQRILKKLNLSYTHSGIKSSIIAMDKNKSKILFKKLKIPSPKGRLVDKNIKKIQTEM